MRRQPDEALSPRGVVRRRGAGTRPSCWAAALLAGIALSLAACGTTEDAAGRSAQELASGAEQAHQRALAERAADPAGRGQAAADRLASAVSGGNAALVLSAQETSGGVEVVTTIGARAGTGGGLAYEQATVGACLRTRATPGSAAGDAGERGTVNTQAVPCPDGIVPAVDGSPVESVITDLRARRSAVPGPGPQGCLSRAGECTGG